MRTQIRTFLLGAISLLPCATSFGVPHTGSCGAAAAAASASAATIRSVCYPSTKRTSTWDTRRSHSRNSNAITTTTKTTTSTALNMMEFIPTSSQTLADTFMAATSSSSSSTSWFNNKDQAEALAGPLFGASLFPYLAFLYFLNVPENDTPKGVTVGFATCLLFVFLTIPAAIAAKLCYGASLADTDWLHGSAESLLTITNLVTVVAFRQALSAKQQQQQQQLDQEETIIRMPPSALSYGPTITWVLILTAFAAVTTLVPAWTGAEQHTPYLNGFMDLGMINDHIDLTTTTTTTTTLFGAAHSEPENALSVATWIIHISSLVEFLVAMGFCWRWADISGNPKWKGLTWGLLPLHSSGITACTLHLFYNQIPILIPLQAFLTCLGNTTAAYATLRLALSNGWKPTSSSSSSLSPPWLLQWMEEGLDIIGNDEVALDNQESSKQKQQAQDSVSLVGFEDLGDALEGDNDLSFLLKLFAGCAVASYLIKYGETFFDFPYEANVSLAVSVILVPSMMNAFKWWKRSQDPTFDGWF